MSLAFAMVAGLLTPAAMAFEEKRIYTVATAHLDTVWNWDFETTVGEYIPKTMNQNFELFEEVDDYTFTFEGAYRYALMKEYYPEEYEQLKAYIDEGRWTVSGSAWENGDVNVPSAEALMRNFLYGNNFFDEEFGQRSVDIYLPDCFGFGYALPSIARHSNLIGFGTQKLEWGFYNEEVDNVGTPPFDLGKWYGVDGSFVYAALNMGNYTSRFGSDPRENEGLLNKLENNWTEHGLPFTIRLHGTGDTGGSPGLGSATSVSKAMAKNDTEEIKVLATSSDQIYKDMDELLTDEQKDTLPTYDNEMPLKDHGVGGYTSRTNSKRWNRMNEMLADVTERSATAAMYLGAEYPQENLTEAWLRVIAHQFHDDLPGTSLMRVYQRTWSEYAVSLNQFAQEYENAVGTVARAMDTRVSQGVPVVVNNPVAKERTGTVDAQVVLDSADYTDVRVYDAAGQEVPAQLSERDGDTYTVLFQATVPSMGYAVYNVVGDNAGYSGSTGLSVSSDGKKLENDRYEVIINDNGNIQQIYDKANGGKALLDAPIRYQLISFGSSTFWPSWELEWGNVSRAPREHFGDKGASIEVIENGPARVTVEITSSAGATTDDLVREDSTLVTTVSLDAAGDTVEVQNVLQWNTIRTLLKVEFPLAVSNPIASYDLDLGVIERENSTEYNYEFPAQKWADVTDEDGNYGVSVFSDSRYGWDKPDDNTLRLTSVYSPEGAFSGEHQQNYQDMGENRYGFAIYGHTDGYENGTQYGADMFNEPMRTFQTEAHAGQLGDTWSFGGLDTEDVQVKAVKKAEDSDEIIVRFGESTGSDGVEATFTLGNGIESFREVYASEEDMESTQAVKLENGKLVFEMSNFTPRTFALTLKPAGVTADTPDYQALDLTYNTDVYSSNDNPGDGGMTVIGNAYPTELLPKDGVITTGGVPFTLGPTRDGADNAVLAGGQTISLPAGTNTVYLLAAAASSEDVEATVRVGNQPVNVTFGSYNENYAAWDLPTIFVAGYIKDMDIGYMSTHTHWLGGDKIAATAYMYKYAIDIPAGVNSITLPDNDEVVVFAATAVNDPARTTAATALYDERERNDMELPDNTEFYTGFEPGDPEPFITTGSNIFIDGATLTVVDDVEGYGESEHVVRLAGVSRGEGRSHAYFQLFDEEIYVTEGTVLSFAFMPTNELSRYMAVDLDFKGGGNLRDSGVTDENGVRMHPAEGKGTVGEWTLVEWDLSALAGRTISSIFFAYDSGGGEGEVEGYLDDLKIEVKAPKTLDDYLKEAKAIEAGDYVEETYDALQEAIDLIEGLIDGNRLRPEDEKDLMDYLRDKLDSLATYRNPYERIEAESFDESGGGLMIDQNASRSGGGNIGGVDPGSWAVYKYCAFDYNGSQLLQFHYSGERGSSVNSYVEVRLGSRTGPVVGRANLPTTGGNWDNYVTLEIPLDTMVSGVHDIYLVFGGDGTHTANVDWIQFEKSTVADTAALQAKVAEAKRLSEKDYTPGSWANLQAAITAAEKVIDRWVSSVEEVEDSLAALELAMDSLIEVPDKTALGALLAEAKALEESKYTAETLIALRLAIADAQLVYDNAEANQARVDAAAKALQAAIDGLEERDEPDTTAPVVLSVFPSGELADLSGKIEITFDEPMDMSVAGKISLNGSVEALEDGQYWSKAGTVCTVFYTGLDSDTEYTIGIEGFADVAGNVMAKNDAHSFTTVDMYSHIHRAYVEGDDDGNFNPDGNLTRAQAATILFNLVDEADLTDVEPKEFPDVQDSSKWYYEAVTTMAGMGAIEGYTNGRFEPDEPINRQEFTAMTVRFFDVEPVAGVCVFSDVEDDGWAAPYINAGVRQGFINGMGDGTFAPADPITRSATVFMVNPITGRGNDLKEVPDGFKTFPDVPKTHWAWGAIVEAANDHICVEADGAMLRNPIG